MAKTIKFNLICDEKPVRTIEDLQNNFSIEDVLDYYNNQLLHRWLSVRGYNSELEAVSAITSNEPTTRRSDMCANKRFFLFTFIFVCAVLNLCGCRSTQQFSEVQSSAAYSLDYQKNSHNSNTPTRYLQFSDNGFYFIDANLAYFCEEPAFAFTPLCTKPECSHDVAVVGENCNALLGNDMQIYNGKLYYYKWSDGNAALFCSSLTGEDETFVMQLRTDGQGALATNMFLIHRGSVIFCSDYGSVKVASLGESLESAVTLFESTQEAKDSWTSRRGHTTDPYAWFFRADEDYLYFMGRWGTLYSNSIFELTYANCLYRYNMVTGETEQVWSLPSEAEVGMWQRGGISTNGWYIEGSRIYYHLSGNGVWVSDLDTGETEQVFSTSGNVDAAGTAFFDGNYIYINNSEYYYADEERTSNEEKFIYIYAMNGDYVRTLSLQALFDAHEYQYIDVVAANGQFLIVQGASRDWYVFDLTASNAEWQPLC